MILKLSKSYNVCPMGSCSAFKLQSESVLGQENKGHHQLAINKNGTGEDKLIGIKPSNYLFLEDLDF